MKKKNVVNNISVCVATKSYSSMMNQITFATDDHIDDSVRPMQVSRVAVLIRSQLKEVFDETN